MNMTSPPQVPPSDIDISSVSLCPGCGADALAPISTSPGVLSCQACGAEWHHCLGYLWHNATSRTNQAVVR